MWFYLYRHIVLVPSHLATPAYPPLIFFQSLLPQSLNHQQQTQEVFEMAQVSEMEHVEQAVRSRFKSAWVICESKSGNKEIYKAAATELGKELVSRGVDIVHDGGESTGLMDCVVKAMQDGGGNVREIIPRRVLGAEGEFVTYMHQRKAEMARHADCFIALPGGYRTLEELLEAVSWSQLGIHDKPVGLLNVNGYYNSFLSFIDNSVDESFIKPSHSNIIVWATNAKELLDKLEDYVPVPDRPLNRESWEV
ncbi:PREDICTED: cytokinin riboside 5'-monophosphate phosphoribohydrolase LOG5-like [Fragaria vesca subsp. vesca]|uniref:cytokinin riboside 5'-monophosphate phosphoribohydrolase LOG1-like n=1 Tax=Fragaria vesca subsp. vesca TaxID=101020 RepID=UPI0002C304AF|nr:PREDICTED: cytokinin riboside 5'-monophosphate phosphoribohydrolase LOG1-like [Fragaria vesca subsp. vesca]